MSVSNTVSQIFSIKEWHDLETEVRGCSSPAGTTWFIVSLEMV